MAFRGEGGDLRGEEGFEGRGGGAVQEERALTSPGRLGPARRHRLRGGHLPLPAAPDQDRLAGGMCQTLSLLTPVLAARWVDKIEEDSCSPQMLRRYAQRLEKALETWEVAYGEALALAEQGHRRMAELERRRSFRWYQRIMRFLGR